MGCYCVMVVTKLLASTQPFDVPSITDFSVVSVSEQNVCRSDVTKHMRARRVQWHNIRRTEMGWWKEGGGAAAIQFHSSRGSRNLQLEHHIFRNPELRLNESSSSSPAGKQIFRMKEALFWPPPYFSWKLGVMLLSTFLEMRLNRWRPLI